MSTPSEERICMRCKKKFRGNIRNAYRHCNNCRALINKYGGYPFAGGTKIGKKEG